MRRTSGPSQYCKTSNRDISSGRRAELLCFMPGSATTQEFEKVEIKKVLVQGVVEPAQLE